ncbi:unnamed protein product [Trifolium pratense]|uniref:Uncharacterized protein n=1 Tax=Trifolium pratense TaxID=57577 RepID=A0ACB0LJT0_TRIPR|nr:unnamed protein product [Trifolium pratense]
MRNMAAVLKFIYVMSLFLSLFHVATSYGGGSRGCKYDKDCPNYLCHPPKVGVCFSNKCYCSN